MVASEARGTANQTSFGGKAVLARKGASTIVAAAVFGFALGLAALALAAAPQVHAQAAAQTAAQASNTPPLEFEVASIKPSGDLNALVASGKMPNFMPKMDDSQMDVHFMSLQQLIIMAYEVKQYQVSGPDWLLTTRFDIEAKLPDGAKKEQIPAMLRALLEERFKLAIHRENKDQQVYALKVGKDGIKMVPSPPDPVEDPNRTPDKNEAVLDTPDGKMTVRTTGRGEGSTINVSGGGRGNIKMSMSNGIMHMETSKLAMSALAEQLSRMLDRPVLDMTELKGNYVVSLDLSMEDMMASARAAGFNPQMGPAGGPAGGGAAASAAPVAADPSGYSVFSSIQKLGLRLDKEKLPVEMIVVDHMEKVATDN